MNRGVVVLGATVLGLAGLLAFDQHQFGDPFALSSKSSGLKLPTSKGASAAAAAPTEAGSTQRAVGDSIPNQYGNVQVKVTVQGGKLTRVTFLDLPYGDPTSQSISDQVAPVLAQQAIDAQSANVAGISGATYTSDGYRKSLQSALDNVGFGQQ